MDDKDNYLGLLITKTKNKYYILKQIGEGATSFVFLAIDKDKKEYAVKLYKNIESYFNETSRLRNIVTTKNIVKLISFGQGNLERGYSYYSHKLFNHFGNEQVNYGLFEYLKNGELFHYVFTIKKKFSEEISRKIFYDIVKAVECCHKSGISHGDIKLENILLNSNFNIKLIDFGFAKFIKEGLISDIAGTKYYNAPEMFFCATKGYDGTLADVFSLGVVLFILVMGFYPFEKPNITDNRYKFISKKDYSGFWKKCEQKMGALKMDTKISSEFKDLVEKMICYKPKERINLENIKYHPWLVGLTESYALDDEKANNGNNCDNSSDSEKYFSPKKSKKKNSSHNPSFYKKNNDCLKIISNNSDGFEHVHINEKNLLNIQKQQKNGPNMKNELKELESLYIKELSLRKIEIEKYLKEQDDEGE